MAYRQTEPVQIRAHGRVVKQLGAWTPAQRFDIRASRGGVSDSDGIVAESVPEVDLAPSLFSVTMYQ
jgi:hypothetical protein